MRSVDWLTAMVVACTACSPRDLRYEARGEERRALLDTATRVADGDVDPSLLDLGARKALIVFGASLAYEKRERIRAAVDEAGASVVVALALRLLGGWSDAQSEASIADSLERASGVLEAQLEREFGASVKQVLGGPDALTAVATQLSAPPARTTERLLEALRSDVPRACRATTVLASYDVRLLRWSKWEHADRSRSFAAWKQRARSLHLVELACEGRSGVALLGRDDQHDGPRVVGWRFSSPEQHARLVDRLGAGPDGGRSPGP